MVYLTGTISQVRAWRATLNSLEKLPMRGVAIGGPDVWPTTYYPRAPGWTDEATPQPIEGALLAAVELPANLEKYLGTNGLPLVTKTLAQLDLTLRLLLGVSP